jgi:hypothetical protein
VRGTRYERIDGLWQAVGESEARGRAAAGGGGGNIIVFDIVDSFAGTVRIHTFLAPADVPVHTDPCTD